MTGEFALGPPALSAPPFTAAPPIGPRISKLLPPPIGIRPALA